ncbi:hypothetical protein [Verrucomicrobium sp. BvORR034]|uniref:hypothetical protein n=1 Tax=Verrucomicrobium sp. BvORR034 TaxID=1396418 RepID=UPI0006796135|nr:hypothetical protein [Verrucomicrobium sp. BvORR034]
MKNESRDAKIHLGKIVISTVVILPLCVAVGGMSLMALFLGIASIPMGILFIALAALGILFLYSMATSLWFDLRDGFTIFGLLAGTLMLGTGAYNIVDDAMRRSFSGIEWTTKNYVETYGLGPLAAAGILLSFILLLRRLPQDLVADRPRAPILVRRLPATSANHARNREARPVKRPYLPTKKA